MDAKGLQEALDSTSGEVVVKVGDQFFKVQSVVNSEDHVMLSLGGNFLPLEGGGVPASQVTPATGTPERDAQSRNPENPADADRKASEIDAGINEGMNEADSEPRNRSSRLGNPNP